MRALPLHDEDGDHVPRRVEEGGVVGVREVHGGGEPVRPGRNRQLRMDEKRVFTEVSRVTSIIG